MSRIEITESVLRSSSAAEELASTLIPRVECGEVLTVDFSSVQRMTPSYANTLVMLLLERFDLQLLKERCCFINRNQLVIEAMNRSAQRYLSGIRLSTQHQISA